jgi:hypothetical protein
MNPIRIPRKLEAILEAARERFRAGEGIPHDTFWKKVEAENAGKAMKRASRRRSRRTGGTVP